MLPKENRIVKEKDIKKIVGSRFRQNTGLFEVIISKSHKKHKKIILEGPNQQSKETETQNITLEKRPEEQQSTQENSKDKIDFTLVIIISKKIYKKATQRKIIKRRLSGIFEKLKFEGRLPLGYKMAVLVKHKDILTTKYFELETMLCQAAKITYKKCSEDGNKLKKSNYKT